MKAIHVLALALCVTGCIFIPTDQTPTGGGTGQGGNTGSGGSPMPTGGGGSLGTGGGQMSAATYAVTRSKLPLIYWLIDQSGSLSFPLDTSHSQCPTGCGQSAPCPASCPTRQDAVRKAVGDIMVARSTEARQGMVVYPAMQGVCSTPSASDVALAPTSTDPAALQLAVLSLKGLLQTRGVMGGTPTAAAIASVSTLVQFDAAPEQAVLVILVTDGMPNCNANNVNTCSDPAMCRCTLAACNGMLCSTGCLDESATVQAVNNLRAGGNVKVMAVGVGQDFSSADARSVLNGIAHAGGVERTCLSGNDNECPVGGCDLASRRCVVAYEAQLTADASALNNRVGELLRALGTCRVILQPSPDDRTQLDVRFSGSPSEEWYLDNSGVVVLTGALCSAFEVNPSSVAFRKP